MPVRVPALVAGPLNGNSALRVARQGQWIFIDDVAAVVPPFRWDVSRDPQTATLEPGACGTVLIGPVTLCDAPLGLLILDASSPGELACVDLPLLRLFAALLGIALSG